MVTPYPEGNAERDQWILAQRQRSRSTPDTTLDPYRPYAFHTESERSASGEVVPIATIFLTNRECPWRCLMCDLWRNTLDETVPPGAIPAQIDYALAQLAPAQQLKLYNSGSFFDPRAIPVADYETITQRLTGFEHVIVESHPALIGDACWRFQEMLDADGTGRLEVAMGLETVHPTVAPRLNKRMSLEHFAATAKELGRRGVALRVFILVKPPFLDDVEALDWARRSLDFAFDCGASVAVLIPTRTGNGALEALAERGEFSPPALATLEAATAYGVALKRGRVFADLWDLERFSSCPHCFSARMERLYAMNLYQKILPCIYCQSCGESPG